MTGEKYYASPVAANGNIYFTSLDDGSITVLKAGSDKPEVSASPSLVTMVVLMNFFWLAEASHGELREQAFDHLVLQAATTSASRSLTILFLLTAPIV